MTTINRHQLMQILDTDLDNQVKADMIMDLVADYQQSLVNRIDNAVGESLDAFRIDKRGNSTDE